MSGALAGLSQYTDSDSDPEDAALPSIRLDGSAHSLTSITRLHENRSVTYESKVATDPTRLKRKLPPLEADALQQDSSGAASGRITTNGLRGDWLCYCFVEVVVGPSLSNCIEQSDDYLQEQLGSDHTVLDLRNRESSTLDNFDDAAQLSTLESSSTVKVRLHISLTRPFTVSSYERDEYVKIATAQVHQLKENISSFPFTFSRIAYLSNDDASRHFMVLEVGSGREKLRSLSTALSTELRRAFRAKVYYEEARFHASIACVMNMTSVSDDRIKLDAAPEPISSRLGTIIDKIEDEWGAELRKCPPVWATRIGIQLGNRITYVDL